MKIIRRLLWVSMGYLTAAGLLWWLHPRILFRPTPLPAAYSFHFDNPFREINIQPRKDVHLNALWFSAHDSAQANTLLPKPKGVVLFLHGNRDNLQRWGREYADRFTDRGYDVLMYDYRGYGKSTGNRSEDALHRDAQVMYNFLKSRMAEDSIIVYGYSLGTGMAARLAANNRPKRLILEAPYASIPVLGRTHLPIFPYEWLMDYKFRTDSCFAHIHCPIHLFHGTRDQTIPYENSRILLNTFTPAQVRLTTIPEGRHRYLNDSPAYRAGLDSLLAN